jgi:signal transduction histidine kinase
MKSASSEVKPAGTDPALKTHLQLVAIVLCFVVAIVWVSYSYYHKQALDTQTGIRDQLTAIADLKMRQIARWRSERQNDALWLLEASAMPAEAGKYFANPGADDLRNSLQARLDAWQKHNDYSHVLLLDTNFQVRLAAPAQATGMDAYTRPFLEQALRTNTIVIVDLHSDPASNRIKMDILVPLLERTGNPAQTGVVGVVMFEIDPAEFLFPLIQTWPTHSQTAETLLVRREGDEVVYLNELRHRTNTALKLRFPLTQTNLPAARLMQGKEGMTEGVDYRGIPVLAVARHVPDSPWGIVAKIDQAEIFAPLRRQAWTTGILAGLLLLAALLFLALLWRRREDHFVRQELEEHKQAEAELKQAHGELLKVSRRAGMADVASGVLHNVGNVLNSVNISAGLISDHLKNSKTGSVTRIAALLRDHAADLGEFITRDSKGRQLPVYLGQLGEHLTDEQAVVLKELELLTKNIEHIKEIVALQQNYARLSGVSETVSVTSLMEDALLMNFGALARQAVKIVREYEPKLPEITVEKHKVLQILVNLIGNAKYACNGSDGKNGSDSKECCITLRVSNSNNRVCIAVIDNGAGIPAENLPKIFTHGFTTRPTGHGFGLHSGLLTAQELGGTLTVQSNGPGKGATFTLEVPLRPPNR